MRRLLIAAALSLGFISPAFATDSTVPAMTGASALTGSELLYCIQGGADRKCTAAQVQTFANGGLGTGFAISPQSLSLVGGGTGYAQNDTLTMGCSGITFSTAPLFVVTHVTTGVIDGISVLNMGVIASPISAQSCTLTQTSTSGVGSGASWTVNLGPLPAINTQGLNTGTGQPHNGNTWVGDSTPNVGMNGTENTFFGAYAGAAMTASGNTAIGEDACGGVNGTNTVTVGNNTCLGNDAGRNASGVFGNNTLVGASAGRVVGGGSGSAQNTMVGFQAGQATTTGFNNTLMGPSVAGTLTTGSHNLVLGTNSSCDVSGSNASDTIEICAGGTPIIKSTGTNTPSTAPTTVSGTLKISGGFTVSTLPSAATVGAGARAYVTDATSCTFAGALTGSGSTFCPVISNGATWQGG